MRVSMEYYMKRRNLGWSSFQGMDYERYEVWCHVRKIVPVSLDEFTAGVSPFVYVEEEQEEPLETVIPPNPAHQDPKALNRKKKGELIEIATLFGLELVGNETKKQIVQLIIDLNNRE